MGEPWGPWGGRLLPQGAGSAGRVERCPFTSEKCHLVTTWSMDPRGAGEALGVQIETGAGVLVRDNGGLDRGGGVAEK